MGQLIQQDIRGLYQGVSRQAPEVRLSSQSENGLNLEYSVVSGGFSPRNGSRLKGFLSPESPFPANAAVHSYKRDSGEKYFIAVSGGAIHVVDGDGVEQTVEYAAGAEAYLADIASAEDAAFATLGDVTFIANRNTTVAMNEAALSEDNPYPTVVFRINSARPKSYYRVGAAGEVDSVTYQAGAVLVTGDNPNGSTYIAGELIGAMLGTAPEEVEFGRHGSHILIRQPAGQDDATAFFYVDQESPNGDREISICHRHVGDDSDLPRYAFEGQIVSVGGDPEEPDYYLKFKLDEEGGETFLDGAGSGVWSETVKPNSVVAFDKTTMPHILIRKPDGDFLFAPADGSYDEDYDWLPRTVGDEDLTPNPEFVGERIRAIGIHRGRLYVLGGETVYFTKADDYFNFWPDSSFDVLDDDPFGRTAGGNAVSVLEHAVGFRKSLIVVSESGQFEVSSGSGLLTPKTATIDSTTDYDMEPLCRPVALGDELYLSAQASTGGEVLEYLYDEASLTNRAQAITAHVRGYIPGSVVSMAGYSVTDHLFARTLSDPTAIYVCRIYWERGQPVQQAWNRWTFAAPIAACRVLDGELWLLHQTVTDAWLSAIPLEEDTPVSGCPYRLIADDLVSLSGVYAPETGLTTWTLPADIYASPHCVLDEDFGDELAGLLLSPEVEIAGTTVTAEGDYTAGDLLVGSAFRAESEFSPQYVRQDEDRALTSGRLQLLRFSVQYDETGYLEIDVTPQARATRRHVLTTFDTGIALGQSSPYPLPGDGSRTVEVKSNAKTVQIKVGSSQPYPFTVSSAHWVGFYNDIARQG